MESYTLSLENKEKVFLLIKNFFGKKFFASASIVGGSHQPPVLIVNQELDTLDLLEIEAGLKFLMRTSKTCFEFVLNHRQHLTVSKEDGGLLFHYYGNGLVKYLRFSLE